MKDTNTIGFICSYKHPKYRKLKYKWFETLEEAPIELSHENGYVLYGHSLGTIKEQSLLEK